jgi:hypothetical protein
MSKRTVSVNIPFHGFYESLWSEEVDREEQQEIEYFETERQSEEGIPSELRLSGEEYGEILMHATDYRSAYLAIARCYVDAFDQIVSEQIGFKLGCVFEEVVSPHYYNFETDRLFVRIQYAAICRLFRMSRADGHRHLAKMIKERHTSYSGFHSYYSNDLKSWLSKPLKDWDHNELCTLLCAVWSSCGGFSQDWHNEIADLMLDGDGLYHEWSAAVDWAEVTRKVVELRAERAADLKRDNPDYVEPTYRCAYTLDLFRDYAVGRVAN